MQVTWSDIDSSDGESSNPRDNNYDQSKNYLTFIALVNSDYHPLNDIEIDENEENGFDDLTEACQILLYESLKVDNKFFYWPPRSPWFFIFLLLLSMQAQIVEWSSNL